MIGFVSRRPRMGRLFDLAFLIRNVLTHYRIKFFEFQLLRRGPLVFGRGIEMASAGR